MPSHVSIPAGGSFIIEGSSPDQVFTPEDFSPEHTMIRDVTAQFVEKEVLPQQERMEQQDWSVTVGLLKRCGELGLLGIEAPTQYGGENLDKVCAMIVAEQMARVGSFAVSYGGQAGIGTLPIVYFGTEAQKQKYLPALCRAEKLAAYALSEAGSGSDALAAKASAVRSPDGRHWILNGEKMWITNAAFADLFITFAQVDGKHFSCFAVEKDYPGVSTGAEERKMGLKGSSTRTLILQNAEVPIDNLIGEIGKGHHVAFNILNIGRAKLGAGAVGASKTALNDSIPYARQRFAFGKPIAAFGAIKHKLAEMAIRTWAAEGMVYRTAGMMDRALEAVDSSDSKGILKAMEEYAIECSILKVFGSEVMDFVVDEAVQIHGGYGYSAEYPVERYYRDARVHRIFEGTNEINRLLITGMLLKRAAAGALPLFSSAALDSSPAAPVEAALQGLKKTFLYTARLAVERFGDAIKNQQETLMHLSDIVMDIYAIDTATRRSAKKGSSGVHALAVEVLTNDAVHRAWFSASQALAAFSEGAVLVDHLTHVQRLLSWTPINTVLARQRIADHIIDQGRYSL